MPVNVNGVNSGPNSSIASQLQSQLAVTATALPAPTFADLRSGLKLFELAGTSDQGLCYWNGIIWIALLSTGSASPAISVTASPATTQNNYAPTGYVAGSTNRLILAAASGGSTFTGLLAGTDNTTILIQNTSTTDSLYFSHLSGSSTSTNQFSNLNASTVAIPPLGAARTTYVVSKWQFA